MAAMSAEGELEKAVVSAWANLPTAAQMSGIPPEFHDHLSTRRQLLRSSHEQAVNILRYSEAVLEFESSRDGFLSISPGDGRDLLQSSKDRGRIWQKKYFDVVSRLESAYMSFTSRFPYHFHSECQPKTSIFDNCMELINTWSFSIWIFFNPLPLWNRSKDGEAVSHDAIRICQSQSIKGCQWAPVCIFRCRVHFRCVFL